MANRTPGRQHQDAVAFGSPAEHALDAPERQVRNPVNAMIASIQEVFQREKVVQARALLAADSPGARVDSLSAGIALGESTDKAEAATASLAPLATGDELAEAEARLLADDEGALGFGDSGEAVPNPLGLLDKNQLAALMVSDKAANQDLWNAAGLLDDDSGLSLKLERRR